MSANVYALLCILLFFVCIYYTYGGMVCSIVRWSKKPTTNKKGKQVQPKLTAAETLKCYMPFYQVLYMRRALYHSYGPWAGIAAVSAICIAIRLLNVLVPINGNVLFITIFIMYLGVFLHIILYAIPTAAVAKMYGCSMFIVILSAIMPHIMAFFIKGSIVTRMEVLKKEEVFSKNNGETHIQSKPNQRPSGHSVSPR